MSTQASSTVSPTPAKAAMMEGIDQAWPVLEAAIRDIDEETFTTTGPDGWSVKDHLAHLEVWERYLLAVLERRSPSSAIGIDLDTIRTTDDDTLNALLVAPTRAQSADQVLAALRDTHVRLRTVIAALPDGDLERLVAGYQPDELGDDTGTITAWITHICDEHLRDHTGWIQELNART